MKRQSPGGFVNISLQIRIAAIGIWAAIALPSVLGYVREKRTHECALRLDAAVAGAAEKTCVITGKAFQTDEKGRVCHPDAEATHHVDSLCATADAPAAIAHPYPGLTKPILIVGISFVVLVGAAFFLV